MSGATARRRFPRRSRRGLGLVDATLAVMVMSGFALYAAQVTGTWAERRLVDGEARALSRLARAGRLLVEGDPEAWTPEGQEPERRTFAELEAADLWPAGRPRTTPGTRRDMTLWLSLAAPGRVTVIARARGDRIPRGLPGAAAGVEGVGAIENEAGETVLRGADVDFDMATLNAFTEGFGRPGDLFALAHAFTGRDCNAYLHRVEVDGCPDATVMAADLDMNGNSVLGADRVRTATLEVGDIEGDVTVTGSVTVGAGLEVDVDGDTTVGDLTVNAGLNVLGAAEVGALTVQGDVSAAGTVSGHDLTFDGAIAVAGEAVLGDVTADTLVAAGVVADRLDALAATYTTLVGATLTVGDLTVTDGCVGC